MRWNLFRTLAEIHDRLADIELAQFHLNRKAEKIMAKQDTLNALVTRIDTAVTGLKADIEDLKAQHEDVDFSGLEARVQGLEGLDAEYPVAAPQEPQE
ncbi:hypothetical protein ACLQ2R_03095 [Streptosporangium sp. DT93]|uniref:hypothetical protein n=1 Tax=Streptosporangium sp. DT93 TaxID=3393428 RepID=UPI003CEBB5E6